MVKLYEVISIFFIDISKITLIDHFYDRFEEEYQDNNMWWNEAIRNTNI